MSFIPEVGQDCEMSVSWHGLWRRCKVLAITNDYAILNFYKPHALAGTEQVYQRNAIKFRPIQTEADKQRDEQIEKISDIFYEMQFRPSIPIEFAYEQGCRIIAPDEYVVKPLTDEQKTKMYEDAPFQTGLANWFIDAVQRELGIGV